MQDNKMRYYLYVRYSHPTVVQLELSTLCGPLWHLANFSTVLQLPYIVAVSSYSEFSLESLALQLIFTRLYLGTN